MKLRIRGNSIRLRLLRGEVTEFGEKGSVRETINFGASRLTYVLKNSAQASKLSAKFNENEIVVSVPIETALEWTETDLITLKGEQEIANGEVLKILVEKDFVCLDRPNDEDNRDAYPNLSHKC
jgi:hypothetical protein